ncbi:hypothetical protein ACFLSZ_04460 [Candidatus Bipolaricaulota bacterium]
MSIALLEAEAQLILKQRIIDADKSRVAKRMGACQRTRRKLHSAVAAGLRSGPAMNVVIDKLTKTRV